MRPTVTQSLMDTKITLHDDVFMDNSDDEPKLEKIIKLHEEVHCEYFAKTLFNRNLFLYYCTFQQHSSAHKVFARGLLRALFSLYALDTVELRLLDYKRIFILSACLNCRFLYSKLKH